MEHPTTSQPAIGLPLLCLGCTTIGETNMKAAIVTAAGKSPIFGEFHEPAAALGMEVITVHAAALSQFSKSRSAGTHYSSEGGFPAVAGADGVGRTEDGRRVYFVLPEATYGALAEKCLVDVRH